MNSHEPHEPQVQLMILVAGLTPAWQQIAVLDRLDLGEVNRASEVHWCASGKVLNVGLALTQLQARCRTVSLVGSGPAGEAIRRDLSASEVDVRWIETTAPQRVCTTLLDRQSKRTTEIVEPFPEVSSSELAAFETAFSEEAASTEIEFVVITGSLPKGTTPDYFARLLEHSRAKAILDVRGPELRAALRHKPFAAKPNREELGQTVGRALRSDSDVWAAISELHRLGLQWSIITNGPNAVLASDGTATMSFDVSPVEVVNPIGCGDCFTAGFACSLQNGRKPTDAIQLGIKAARQNASQLLPARLNRDQLLSERFDSRG